MTHAATLPPVVLIAPTPIRANMLGPGLRYWQFACELAKRQRVTLLCPNADFPSPTGFTIAHYERPGVLDAALASHAVAVVQGYALAFWPTLREAITRTKPYLAVDIYTPLNLEGLESRHGDTSPLSLELNRTDLSALMDQLALGDYFFCASERQRHYYLGMLAAASRLNPHVHADDHLFRRLIDVVSFGLPSEPPQPSARGPVLKGVHPHIGVDDKVILWFGGMWNWLDPVGVIQAFAQVASKRPDARLVIVTQPPADLDESVARAYMEARQASQATGLEGQSILWLDPVPFAQRGALLLEADIGVSFHRPSVETTFAFRTRLLDFIWAGLPIVAADGDVLGDEVGLRGLGCTVAAGDVSQLRDALLAVLAEPDARGERAQTFAEARRQFEWARVMQPLSAYCAAPWRAAGRDVPFYQTQDPWSIEVERELYKRELAHAQAEIASLRELVQRYESGRVMTLMRKLHGLRSKTQDNP